MDVANLRETLDQFLGAAESGRFGPAPAGTWRAELVLAHVTVVQRLIAQSAGVVLSGGQPRADNRSSHSLPYLEALIKTAGGWEDLVKGVRQSGRS